MSYYYLVASLPLLERGDPPPMTADEFLFHCTGPLSTADWMELQHVIGGDAEHCTSEAGKRWFAADAQLRNAATRVRANRLGVDPGDFLEAHPGFDNRIEKAVTDAFAKPTPLEMETTLDTCRWRILEDMETDDPFGLGSVLAFAVKLSITRRWHDMSEEAGRARVEALIEDQTGEEAWHEFFATNEDNERASEQSGPEVGA